VNPNDEDNYVLASHALCPGKYHSKIDHHSKAILLIENKVNHLDDLRLNSVSKTVTVTLDLLLPY